MKLICKIFLYFFIVTVGITLFYPSSSNAASTPYDVESSVRSGWNSTYGGKNYDMTSARKLVYDVYANKYTSGGYQVTWRDFGKGNQPYLNFQGWGVLFGHKRHTSTNHETYIVAKKISGDSGVGTTYVYGTLPINISATEDLEYNNQGAGVWNECASWQTNKNNEDCNMRYDNVGFNAYLPLNELFPNQQENAKWQLYIVKRVDSHIVYTQLILPFQFDNRSFNGGTLSLSSGVNANNLVMVGSGVIRRTYPRQPANTIGPYYFTTTKVYKRVSHDETATSVWYGVSTPEDGYATRWASTAYWGFGGDQAVINYTPPPDTDPPSHIAHSLSGARYQNGNDYWVQPNDRPWIRLRQYDETGNLYQYLRLYGSGVDARSQHDFRQGWQHNNHWYTDPNVKINAAGREEATKYGRVAWEVIPYTHGHTYDVQYYYRDTENNVIGYNNTGMRLRVDGVEPSHNSMEILNYRYRNGNDWWVKPGDQVYIRLRQYDPHSGNRYQYLKLYGSGQEARSQHDFFNAYNHNNHWWTNSNVVINSATREENTAYGKVKWGVVPKTHGHGYNIMYYYRDNADNVPSDYIDTNQDLWVDGVGPSIQFRNSADTSDYFSRSWSTTSVDVRLKFSDPHSGYKRSRYAWTQSTSTPTSWSAWTTSSNYTVSKTNYGQWYLHVQSEDNVGNITTTYKGTYNFNNPPVANFTWSPTTIYNDTTVAFTNTSSDPDGDPITYQWAYQTPNSSTWVNFSTVKNPSKILNIKGTWKIRLTVTDKDGATNSIIKSPVVINRPPVADFMVPSPIFEGDTFVLDNISTDPDKDSLTAKWTIVDPNNVSTSQINWDSTITNAIPGIYKVTLTVTDPDNSSVSITKNIEVKANYLTAEINHIQKWTDYYYEIGRDLGTFLAGEPFDVVVETSSNSKTVEVTFDFPVATKEVPEAFLENPWDDPYPDFAASFNADTLNYVNWNLTAWKKYWIMILDGQYNVKVKATYLNGTTKEIILKVDILDHILWNKKVGYSNRG
ncbi:PKD domain-containing protein [Mesobacillus sp.]|uniref:PKD domain-containing protein n=1 Tax=Mesobacillus sp. TaxID=2675271 RepID=UPI0039EEB670